jgi:hypothetical protein
MHFMQVVYIFNNITHIYFIWRNIIKIHLLSDICCPSIQQNQIYNYNKRKTTMFLSLICQRTNTLPKRPYIICLTNDIPNTSIKFNLARAVASCRQFSAYKVGVLNDKSKAYIITRRAWPCCVIKYCLMQTHALPYKIGCRRRALINL